MYARLGEPPHQYSAAAPSVLRELYRIGATVTLGEPGRLKIHAPIGAFTPTHLAAVKVVKSELLALLAPDHEWTLDESAAAGRIPPGWTAAAWHERCMLLSDQYWRRAQYHWERAERYAGHSHDYSLWAFIIDRNIAGEEF